MPLSRNRLRVPLAIAALVAVAASAMACGRGQNGQNTPDASRPPTATGLAPEQAARVIAKVGDRNITLGDFAASLEHMDQFDRLRYQSPERRMELLQEMIRVQLLADEAVAKGYDKDPIAAQELRAVLRDAVLDEAKKNARAPADVPANDVRAYFEAHRAEYKDPERRRLSVIVVRDEASAMAVLDAYKQQVARSKTSVQGEKPEVVTWGELVRAKSIEAQAKANVPLDLAGDVGFVSPPGDPRGTNPRIPEEVRAAGFALAAVGDVAPKPVRAQGKVYLVRFSQKVDARERTFEEAERTIRVKLAQDDIKKKEEELLAGLRKEFPVQIDEAALAQVRVEATDAGTRD